MHIASCAQSVSLEVQDRVRDQLARPVKCRLAPPERFLEFGARRCEVLLLLGGYSTDFAATTSVDGVELCREDCRRDGEYFGAFGFVGEEARGEGVLELAGVAVAGEVGEVEVAEKHLLLYNL